MFGKLELVELVGCKLPQKAASAWSIMGDLIGAEYEPVLYYATQPVRGVNHYFIAKQTVACQPAFSRLVKVVINEFAGEMTLAKVEEI